MKLIYLGYKGGLREVFRPDAPPTEKSHPQYNAVVGPFQTVRGAKFMLHCGDGNPHCTSVSQAERLGKQHADAVKSAPLSVRRY